MWLALYFNLRIYIKVWFLLIYMVSFINIMSLLSNTHFKKYYNLFWKAIYFGHELLKNRPKHLQFVLISLILWLYPFYIYECFSYMSIILIFFFFNFTVTKLSWHILCCLTSKNIYLLQNGSAIHLSIHLHVIKVSIVFLNLTTNNWTNIVLILLFFLPNF